MLKKKTKERLVHFYGSYSSEQSRMNGSIAQLSEYAVAGVEIKDATAFCFSGGGSRSLAATTGQLAGLNHFGLLDPERSGMISATSGGAWCSIIYTYRDEKISDTELLGEYCEPGKLQWDAGEENKTACNLSYASQKAMTRIPSGLSLMDALITAGTIKLIYGAEWNEVWAKLIGALILNSHDLNKTSLVSGDNTRYMGDTASCMRHNPADIAEKKFSLRPKNRIPLVVTAAMFPDEKEAPELLLPLEIDGKFAGIPSSYQWKNETLGGFVSTYGFGSSTPASYEKNKGLAEVKLDVFALSDAAGVTSSFYASALTSILGDIANLEDKFLNENIEKAIQRFNLEGVAPKVEALKNALETLKEADLYQLLPAYNYWSAEELKKVEDGESVSCRKRMFADGGNLENCGLIPALRKGYKKIIQFLNIPLKVEYVDDILCIDESVPSLFGYTGLVSLRKGEKPAYHRFKDLTEEELANVPVVNRPRSDNQVFAHEGFSVFLDHLAESNSQNGTPGKGSPIIKQRLMTIENKKFAIPAGIETEIVWFYLTADENWTNQLSPELQHIVKTECVNFPNYDTVAQIDLSITRANLVRQFCEWQIRENIGLMLSHDDGGYDYKWPQQITRYQKGTRVQFEGAIYECIADVDQSTAIRPESGSKWQKIWEK